MAEDEGSFFSGLFWGGVIGAALGLLYAPDVGTETRKKLQEKLEMLQIDSEKTIETTKKSIEDGLSKLSVAVEEARKAAEEKKRELEKL